MIKTTGLRKSYTTRVRRQTTTVEAVRGVDLAVAEGEILGFLGPNGAGKTTTLRMLATLLAPDGGEAEIFGADLRTDPAAVRTRIGYVAQQGGTADLATAREELVIQGRVHGLAKTAAAERAEEAIAAFGMAEYADRPCQTYSGGQRRRLDIALGVVHRPRALLLDEPTVGLDPASRAQVWAEVRRLRAAGMTVLLTTHYLDEADSLCDRVAIIDHGGVVAEGSPAELKRGISGDVVLVGLGVPEGGVAVPAAGADGNGDAAGNAGDDGDPADRLARAEAALASADFVRKLESPGGETLRVYADDGAWAIPPILKALTAAGIEPEFVQLQRPSLDDVFLTHTGRTIAQS